MELAVPSSYSVLWLRESERERGEGGGGHSMSRQNIATDLLLCNLGERTHEHDPSNRDQDDCPSSNRVDPNPKLGSRDQGLPIVELSRPKPQTRKSRSR